MLMLYNISTMKKSFSTNSKILNAFVFLAIFFIFSTFISSASATGCDTCAEKGQTDLYQSDVKSAANEYVASHPEIADLPSYGAGDGGSDEGEAAVAQLRDGVIAILTERGFQAEKIADSADSTKFYPQMVNVWKDGDPDKHAYRVTGGGGIISEAIKVGYCGGHSTFAGEDIIPPTPACLALGEAPGGAPFPDKPVLAPPTEGLPTNLGQLIQMIFAWSLGILGISVFVMFFYSGFLWLTAAGNTSKIGEAKTHMTNAVFGAILLLSSYLILYTINPDFVKNTVDLPGLETIK